MGTSSEDLKPKKVTTKCFLQCPYGVRSVQGHCCLDDRRYWGLYHGPSCYHIRYPEKCDVIEIMNNAIAPRRSVNAKA